MRTRVVMMRMVVMRRLLLLLLLLLWIVFARWAQEKVTTERQEARRFGGLVPMVRALV